MNLIIIKQDGGSDFFISSNNAMIISVSSLAYLLKFLAENDYINIKVLEGIVEDVRNQTDVV
jgi:hypothetical protein